MKPCQDLSHAGKRAGMRPGTRSALWTQMAYAVDQLRPAYVVAENVRGLLSGFAYSDLEPCPWCMGDTGQGSVLRALGSVLGDLADIGYDARWVGLRAADVGAPHGRFRVFVLATDSRGVGRDGRSSRVGARRDTAVRQQASDHPGDGTTPTENARPASSQRRLAAPGEAEGWRSRADAGRRSGTPVTDADQQGREGAEPAGRRHLPDRSTTADPAGDGRHEGWPEPDVDGRSSPDLAWGDYEPAPQGGSGEVPCSCAAWGHYAPAIHRWEVILSRLAPAPTELGPKGSHRLSPRAVEFMMGLPDGWVTDVPGLSRNAQLKALGNGVVPQQCLAALRLMDTTEAAA